MIGLFVFYFPVYVGIIYSLVVYLILWNKLKNISNLSSYPDINLLKNFPLVIILSYTLGSVYRVLNTMDVASEDLEMI
jgi:hypothetical protein